MKSAVRKGLIAENPCPLVENKPKADPKEMKTWTPVQLSKFFESARAGFGLQIYLFFRLMFETGCRRGEAAALQWTDIEFDEERTIVHVRRSLVKPSSDPVFGPPKKHQRRRIGIGHQVAGLLREHRIKQNEIKLKLGGQYRDFGLVFAKDLSWPGYIGCPLQVNNIGRRIWKKIIDAAEVPYIRIHDLRQTAATIQLPHTNVKQVQKRLGHKRIETTLNIYAHAIPELDEAVADVLGAVAGATQKGH